MRNTVAFSAKKLAFAPNVTGDGTLYVIQGYSEDYDVGNDFNITTGVFTAPIDGFYIFNTILNYTGILAAHTIGNAMMDFNPSPPADPFIFGINPAQSAQSNGNLIIGGTVMAQLSTNATVQIQTRFSQGTKVIDVSVIEFSGIKLS